ncbi:MAG: Nif3-like dinuclear metal center hexameric protein [Planctomycetes bacterium]|nr:Nif3-like dinuclear metal center hexameric protein [Planctomycetota bacterium]
MANASEIIRFMEEYAPPRLAREGDPIGLQAGSVHRQVKAVMLAMDATLETVAEAESKGAQMLVTHHPAFYGGINNLDEDEAKGALAAMILRKRLVVYAAHTNLDVTKGGVGDCLADLVGLKEERRPLEVTGCDPFLKLVTFVPESHLRRVKKAVCSSGAGSYGGYSNCTYRVLGTGTFKGADTSSPYLGKAGQYEEVEEWRLESRLLASQKPQVEAALLKAHPYEMPAYEFVRLDDGIPCGLGRVGELRGKISLVGLAKKLARQLKAPGVQFFGREKQSIKLVAVWGGSGGHAIKLAAEKGIDALVLGECGYHDVEIAQHYGLGIVRLGHGVSEYPALLPLARAMRKAIKGVKILVSRNRAALFYNV